MQLKERVLLGAFSEGWVSARRELPGGPASVSGSVVSWESSESLSQLEWEECAGEREREKCSPSPREREEDALFRAGQRQEGLCCLQ